jgi:hypothetical protein
VQESLEFQTRHTLVRQKRFEDDEP